MNELNYIDKLLVIYRTKPFLIGELLMAIGLLLINWFTQIEKEEFGLLLLIVGISIICYKIYKSNKYIRIIQNGTKTLATLEGINKTDWERNNRTVNQYVFVYTIEGKKQYYYHSSAYLRHLKIGYKAEIIVSKIDKKDAFIPELEGLKKMKK